jgi:hypothetical protein
MHKLRQSESWKRLTDEETRRGERYTEVMRGLKLLGFLSGAVPAHHHSHDTEAFPSPSDPNASPPAFAAHAFAALQNADTELGLGTHSLTQPRNSASSNNSVKQAHSMALVSELVLELRSSV